MLAKAYDHQVRVYVSNGSVAHFTLREMHELYRTWQMWVLVLVGFFIMSTGHPITLPQFDSFGLRMAFWVIALLFYLVSCDLYSQLTGKMWHRIFGGPIPLILLSTPLVLASTYAAGALLTVLFEPHDGLFTIMTWQMNLRNVLVAHVFETAALLWLIPAQRERAARKTVRQRTVTLAGSSYARPALAASRRPSITWRCTARTRSPSFASGCRHSLNRSRQRTVSRHIARTGWRATRPPI